MSTGGANMDTSDKAELEAPLTPEEFIWVNKLADRLPDDVDLTFYESKILTRLPIREWPAELLLKVKDVIDIEDFLIENREELI
jgi:hypothetical protein